MYVILLAWLSRLLRHKHIINSQIKLRHVCAFAPRMCLSSSPLYVFCIFINCGQKPNSVGWAFKVIASNHNGTAAEWRVEHFFLFNFRIILTIFTYARARAITNLIIKRRGKKAFASLSSYINVYYYTTTRRTLIAIHHHSLTIYIHLQHAQHHAYNLDDVLIIVSSSFFYIPFLC